MSLRCHKHFNVKKLCKLPLYPARVRIMIRIRDNPFQRIFVLEKSYYIYLSDQNKKQTALRLLSELSA